MNVKETCCCQASFDLYDEAVTLDSPTVAEAKRVRFDTKHAEWVRSHERCRTAWAAWVENRTRAAIAMKESE